MSGPELKPCPHCAGTDIRIDAHPGAGTGIYHRGETVYSMCCYECGATFPNRYRRELLVEAWNTRALTAAPQPAPAVGEREAELVKALEPFARIANEVFRDGMNEHRRDDDGVWGFDNETLTFGALRAARAAIKPSLEQE